jgi:hypothetical protein
MRPIKTLTAVAILLLALSVIPAAPASSIDMAEKFARIRADMFKKELGLNNEQAAAIEKICHETFLQMQETANGMDPVKEGEAMVQQLLMQLQRRNADLQKVLKEDQLAAYQDNKTVRYAELVTELLMVQLDLSEAQTGQVHEVNLKAFETVAAYMPKAQEGTKKGQRRAGRSIQTVLQSRDEAFREILTDKQWEAYESYKSAIDKMFGE